MEIHTAFVTCPDRDCASALSTKALQSGLVACVNVIPGVTSLYHWKGKIEQSEEYLLMMKTTTPYLEQLERLVVEAHPYDVPEFVCIQASKVGDLYNKWVCTELDNTELDNTELGNTEIGNTEIDNTPLHNTERDK